MVIDNLIADDVSFFFFFFFLVNGFCGIIFFGMWFSFFILAFL